MATIKTLSATSLLAVLLSIGCGRGTRNTPVSSGNLLVAVDSARQTLAADNIATNGSLSLNATAGTFQQPTKVLTLGNNIYVLNSGSNSVSQFSFSSTGGVSTIQSLLTGTGPAQFAFDPTNSFLVVANQGSKSLSVYSVGSDGTLQSLNNGFPLTFAPLSLAFAGDILYAASTTEITGLRLDLATGALTVVSNFSLLNSQLSYLLADSSGTHLFATDLATNTVFAFSIAPATGSLTQLAVTPTGTGPTIMIFDAGSRFLYIVNSVSNDVSVLSLDATTGTLTTVSGSPFPTLLPGANCVAFDSNDGFLFVGSANGKQVATLQVNSTTGALSPVPNSPFPLTLAPASLALLQPTP